MTSIRTPGSHRLSSGSRRAGRSLRSMRSCPGASKPERPQLHAYREAGSGRGRQLPRWARRLRRSRSYSAVHTGPFTVDVLFELNNDELLITDYALDEITD